MENTHEPQHGGSDLVDPLSHLELLGRSKIAPGSESFFNFGPWWYALLCANVIAGLSLWGGVVDTTLGAAGAIVVRPAAIVVALVSAAILAVHGLRNERVKAKPTMTGFVLTIVAVIVIMAVLGIWGAAISAIGWDQVTAFEVVLGWALTTAFFLGLRKGLHRVRDSRRVAPAT